VFDIFPPQRTQRYTQRTQSISNSNFSHPIDEIIIFTLCVSACGAFFQKALAFEKKDSKGVRYFNAAN
jgi:hypothetical protein